MSLKKLRSVLSSMKHYPAYPGLVLPDNMMYLNMLDCISTLLNREDYKYRKTLMNKLSPASDTVSIDELAGYLIADMSNNETLQNTLTFMRDLVASIDWKEKAQTSKKAFLINHKIDLSAPENECVLKLATSPEILRPISQYLGTFPILSSAALWYSPNENPEPKGSQLYHLDGEDIKQVKCFIPIEEITADTGPLTLLPADISDKIYNELYADGTIKRRNTKLEDDVLYQKTDENNAVQIVGKPGVVSFVDTCRCYHYGSRAASKPRILLHLHYYSAFSKMMPLWGRTEKPVPEHSFCAPEITQALMGKSHLTFPNLRAAQQHK